MVGNGDATRNSNGNCDGGRYSESECYPHRIAHTHAHTD